jgi:hypothetical protein
MAQITCRWHSSRHPSYAGSCMRYSSSHVVSTPPRPPSPCSKALLEDPLSSHAQPTTLRMATQRAACAALISTSSTHRPPAAPMRALGAARVPQQRPAGTETLQAHREMPLLARQRRPAAAQSTCPGGGSMHQQGHSGARVRQQRAINTRKHQSTLAPLPCDAWQRVVVLHKQLRAQHTSV